MVPEGSIDPGQHVGNGRRVLRPAEEVRVGLGEGISVRVERGDEVDGVVDELVGGFGRERSRVEFAGNEER